MKDTITVKLGHHDVANDQVIRRHHALADGGRRAQDTVVFQADADVTVVGRNPPLLKDKLPDLDDILS